MTLSLFPRGFEQKQQKIMVDRQLGSGHEHQGMKMGMRMNREGSFTNVKVEKTTIMRVIPIRVRKFRHLIFMHFTGTLSRVIRKKENG